MENSFTHCIIHVMPLVTLICNEKLLSSCPTKTIMNKRGFSQTKWINWDILQSPNVPEVGFLQPCNHNQVAQHQESIRSSLFYCPNSKFIQNGCFILLYPFKVHYSLIETMRYKCVKLVLPKKLFFLVYCLLCPLSIKIISQSSITQCPSTIKWAWEETWMTEWLLQNFLWQLR